MFVRKVASDGAVDGWCVCCDSPSLDVISLDDDLAKQKRPYMLCVDCHREIQDQIARYENRRIRQQ